MLSLAYLRITPDPCHLLLFTWSWKNKPSLLVIANRFHQQIAIKYRHGINPVTFSLHFLKSPFCFQRVTHHMQSDVNFHFWLKASEGPARRMWHGIYTPKASKIFSAQHSSPKSTFGFLNIRARGSQYIREVLKRQEVVYQQSVFYPPKFAPSRSDLNATGAETGPTYFPNRLLFHRLSGLVVISKRHRLAKPLQPATYCSISASAFPAAVGKKPHSIQETMADNPENCEIARHAFRQKWPVFNDRPDGNGLRQYIFFSPEVDLITVQKKTPFYKTHGAAENLNLPAGLASIDITNARNREAPRSATPPLSICGTYDLTQKLHKTHSKHDLNPDNVSISFAGDKYPSLKKYPPTYLPGREEKGWLETFNRLAQTLKSDWMSPGQLSFLKPRLSTTVYNNNQRRWPAGRTVGFRQLADSPEKMRVLPKPFLPGADHRINRHGSDGKTSPRMRLLNLSQPAAVIEKTDKKSKSRPVTNLPKMKANQNGLPVSDLNSLVDKVYNQIAHRIKRERELKGR